MTPPASSSSEDDLLPTQAPLLPPQGPQVVDMEDSSIDLEIDNNTSMKKKKHKCFRKLRKSEKHREDEAQDAKSQKVTVCWG